MLSHDRLVELLHYDPLTGVFHRLKHTTEGQGGCRWHSLLGRPCGWRQGHGYIGIRVEGRKYAAHRLAWFYVHGVWPEGEIDHRNGVPSDNRIANLRDATHQQNVQSRKIGAANKTGVKGVHWSLYSRGKGRGRRGRWIATIGDGKRQRRIGRFKTFEEAVAAREAAARALHGEFYRER